MGPTPNRVRIAAWGLPILVCVLLAGCGAKDDASSGAGSKDDAAVREARMAAIRAQTQVAEGVTQEGKAAIDFQVLKQGGGTFALTELKGHVVLLDFWATYCKPCAKTIPMLINLQQKYGPQGLMIVGLSEESEEKVAPFAQKVGVTYTLAHSTPALTDAYDARGLPSLWLIDASNIAVKHYVGYSPASEQELDALLQKLLPKK